jgi:hypothetical protein
MCSANNLRREIQGIDVSTITTNLLTAMTLHKQLATYDMTVISNSPYAPD